MKLEDCKPGTRVRVYAHYNFESFKGEIERVIDDGTNRVVLKGHAFFLFHPQQLRRIVKRIVKKKRPEIVVAVSKEPDDFGSRIAAVSDNIKNENAVETWKNKG